MSEIGGEGFEVFKKVVVRLVKMLPGLAKDLATFVLKFAKAFIAGLPPVLAFVAARQGSGPPLAGGDSQWLTVC